jgi:hypothetical protein
MDSRQTSMPVEESKVTVRSAGLEKCCLTAAVTLREPCSVTAQRCAISRSGKHRLSPMSLSIQPFGMAKPLHSERPDISADGGCHERQTDLETAWNEC